MTGNSLGSRARRVGDGPREMNWDFERANGYPNELPPLLCKGEPAPYRIENAGGRSRMVFTCDHASHTVPRRLGNLGLDSEDLQRHIGWDIGAAEVSLRLAKRFDAPAVLSGYSRLVIDCNRTPASKTSILESSDGIRIPGNIGLAPEEASRRAAELFVPYHRAIASVLDSIRGTGATPVFVAVHSFTAKMNGGPPRPWHFGVLWDEDPRVAVPLIEALRQNDGVLVGDNQPYSGRDHFDFSQDFHASSRGIPSALVEIRENLLRDETGIIRFSDMLGDALEHTVKNLQRASRKQ